MWHIRFTHPEEDREVLCSGLILNGRPKQCISTAPEPGYESWTNNCEWSALAITLPGRLLALSWTLDIPLLTHTNPHLWLKIFNDFKGWVSVYLCRRLNAIVEQQKASRKFITRTWSELLLTSNRKVGNRKARMFWNSRVFRPRLLGSWSNSSS